MGRIRECCEEDDTRVWVIDLRPSLGGASMRRSSEWLWQWRALYMHSRPLLLCLSKRLNMLRISSLPPSMRFTNSS